MRFCALAPRWARQTRIVALAVALVGVMAFGADQPAVAAPRTLAAAPPEVTICISNSSLCADVKDDQNVASQPVWLYQASGAKDYHWFKVTKTCSAGTCYEFQDAQKTSLCLAQENPPYGNEAVIIEIQPCSEGVYWYIKSGGYMPNNQNYGLDFFYLAAPNPVQDKDILQPVAGTLSSAYTYTWTVS